MKILYISPENTVGTLSLWKEEHTNRGHDCRTLTFFRSPKGYEEDICLELPFNFTKRYMAFIRNRIYKYYRGPEGYFIEKAGFPPVWSPDGLFDYTFLRLKDFIWRPTIEAAIEKYRLYDFDIIHFESGSDFLKDESFSKTLNKMGKKIICHYHGEDLRSRGVMPFINSISALNLTNEVDLLAKHPDIKYLFLPFKTSDFSPKNYLNETICVSHAPTNRYYKGSEIIIEICKKLESEDLISFDLIENLPHDIVISRKRQSDIFIDQIGDKGGWGYGMNSVESLSMGICTLTEINDTYNSFIPDHPFINVNKSTLEKRLRALIAKKQDIKKHGMESLEWVERNHNIGKVADRLYSYYETLGLPL